MVGRRLWARKWGRREIPFLEPTMKRNLFFPSIRLIAKAIATLAAFFPVFMSPSAALPSANDGGKPSVYDILREFNFPIGLVPEGAVGCHLDRTTGKFEAKLNGSCNFSPDESYELKYKSTVSGQVSRNRLTDLKGVSVKIMFFWLNIVEVVRVGDDLEFSVGMASASFPVENFAECPECVCGVDRKKGKLRKIKTSKSLISSV